MQVDEEPSLGGLGMRRLNGRSHYESSSEWQPAIIGLNSIGKQLPVVGTSSPLPCLVLRGCRCCPSPQARSLSPQTGTSPAVHFSLARGGKDHLCLGKRARKDGGRIGRTLRLFVVFARLATRYLKNTYTSHGLLRRIRWLACPGPENNSVVVQWTKPASARPASADHAAPRPYPEATALRLLQTTAKVTFVSCCSALVSTSSPKCRSLRLPY